MVVEFGKAFEMPLEATSQDDLVKASYSIVIDDFLKIRKENFPNWFELPEIKITKIILNKIGISWYLAVPEDQVYQDDETLWDQ